MANIHSDKGNYARFAGPSRAASAAEDKLIERRSPIESCSDRELCKNMDTIHCFCQEVLSAEL